MWCQCAKEQGSDLKAPPKAPVGALLLCLALLTPIFLDHVRAEVYSRNASSCQQCHMMPSKLGSGPLIVDRVGKLTHGRFLPGSEGGIRHREGSQVVPPGNTTMTGERVSLSLLGDGYIEAIDSQDMQRNADQQRRGESGIAGTTVSAPVLELSAAKPRVQAGRFGWKSQHSSLMSACADSLRNELGIRNQLYPDEYANHKPIGSSHSFRYS